MLSPMRTVTDFIRRDLQEFTAEWRLNLAPKGSSARNPFRVAFWRQQCGQFAIEWRLDRLRIRSWHDANALATGIVLNVAKLVLVVGAVAGIAHLLGMNPGATSTLGGIAGAGMLRAMLKGENH